VRRTSTHPDQRPQKNSMATIDYILIGGGDQGRVTAEAILQSGHRVVKVFDARPCEPVPGVISSGDYDPNQDLSGQLIISIGQNAIRKSYAAKLAHRVGTIFHPSSIVSTLSEFGEGTVVLHGAIIQLNAIIGRHVIINTRASIDHDARIGDYVHIAPGAVLCGRVSVGEGTLIGAGAVVLPGISIGKWAVIAAGSVVTTPVGDGAIVRGNPARIIKEESLSK